MKFLFLKIFKQYGKLLDKILPLSTLNIHIPGTPTLLVSTILRILELRDPRIVTWLMPSPTLIPTTASSLELILDHCMSSY